MTGARPPLSVIIATTKPWPEIRATLDSLLPQARALGAGVIVGDGDGRGLSDPPALPDVVRIPEPGASVFRLRALGRARARGEVVAITEDHCRLRDDWCAAVIDAHRRHPEADVIGGVVSAVRSMPTRIARASRSASGRSRRGGRRSVSRRRRAC